MGLQCTWLLILLLACTYSITNVTIDPFPKNWLKFKCCKENEIIAKKKCQSLVSKDDTAMNSTDNNLTKLKCKDFALIQHTEWDNITENGSLYNSNKSKIIASPGTFCMYIINGTNNYISLIICQSPKTDPKNPKPRKSIEPTFKLILYRILTTMSALFSFITILVYILIKDLRNLFGKSLISYQVTMCVVDYFSILGFWPNDDEGAPRCNFIISAYLFYYSALASAFWINVISFDVWWTFSGYRPYRSIYENENKRFLIYSMYAWGFPFLFSMILCCIEYIKPINDMVTIRPDFSLDNKCRLNTREAIMLYLNGPMTIITIINTLMFIHTSIRINKGLRERKNNFKKEDKLTFMKYLKLFMVMGVSFAIEIAISGLIEIYGRNIDSIIITTFDYLNCINMLNGVIIFILFVCTKSVLELTNKQFCTRFQLFKPNNNNINNTSRSTCATPSFTRSKL